MKNFALHGYDGGPNGDGDGDTDAARRESVNADKGDDEGGGDEHIPSMP